MSFNSVSCIELPYNVVLARRNNNQASFNFPNGQKDGCWIWYQTCSGAGTLIHNEREYIIEEGMGFLLDDGPCFCCPLDKTKPWYTRCVKFNGSGVPSLLEALGLKSGSVLYLDYISYFNDIIDKIVNYYCYGESEKKWYYMSALLYQLLTDIAMRSKNVPFYRTKYSKDYMNTVIEFMKRNVYSTPQLSDFAKAVQITPQHLCSIFKKHMNISPQQYFIQLKIHTAKTMLSNANNMSVKEISDRLNFSSPNYFGYVFKKNVGCTPKEYRENIFRRSSI